MFIKPITMKNNIKKNRILFIEGAKKIIANLGAKIISLPTFACENTKYLLKTKTNVLNIILYEENHQEFLYSVFCRFETPCKEANNQHSGKHNFHLASKLPIPEILKELENHLKNAIEV